MTDDATAAQYEKPANLTRANVTGKVPMISKPMRHGRRKAVRMSASKKRHVGSLKKTGVISERAAASHKL